jgi:hypothetical protein
LRVVILDADRIVIDFRLVQKIASLLELQLVLETSQLSATNINFDLLSYLAKIGGAADIEVKVSFGIESIHFQKLRRTSSELGYGH